MIKNSNDIQNLFLLYIFLADVRNVMVRSKFDTFYCMTSQYNIINRRLLFQSPTQHVIKNSSPEHSVLGSVLALMQA